MSKKQLKKSEEFYAQRAKEKAELATTTKEERIARAREEREAAKAALAATEGENREPVVKKVTVDEMFRVAAEEEVKKLKKSAATSVKRSAKRSAKKPPKAKKEAPHTDVEHLPLSKVKSTVNVAPSIEIATELQHAFDFFNNKLFGGKLEPVIFSNCRLKKSKGYFWPKQWARRKDVKGKVHEIGLDFARLHGENDKAVLSTLVHEMAHLADEQNGTAPKKPYHGKTWVAFMQMVGLTPVILDAKGMPTGKLTGPNSTHEIDKGGKYELAYDELAKTGFKLSWASEAVIEPEKKSKGKKKAGAKAKHTCPKCGVNAWGKPTLHLYCQDNHELTEMECPDREEYEGSEGGEAGDVDEGTTNDR